MFLVNYRCYKWLFISLNISEFSRMSDPNLCPMGRRGTSDPTPEALKQTNPLISLNASPRFQFFPAGFSDHSCRAISHPGVWFWARGLQQTFSISFGGELSQVSVREGNFFLDLSHVQQSTLAELQLMNVCPEVKVPH